jgi:hypothetical protein
MHYVLNWIIALATVTVLIIAAIDSILFFAYTGDYGQSITNHVGIANTGINVSMLKGIQGYILAAMAAYLLLWGGFRAIRK